MMANDVFTFLYNIIDWVLGIGGGVMAWMIRSVHNKFNEHTASIQNLRDDHNKFQNEVAKDYLPRQSFDSCISRIDDKLDDIMRILISRNK